jgi:hypothetical protein
VGIQAATAIVNRLHTVEDLKSMILVNRCFSVAGQQVLFRNVELRGFDEAQRFIQCILLNIVNTERYTDVWLSVQNICLHLQQELQNAGPPVAIVESVATVLPLLQNLRSLTITTPDWLPIGEVGRPLSVIVPPGFVTFRLLVSLSHIIISDVCECI